MSMLVRYHRDDGCFAAIVIPGRKWLHAVMLDGFPVRVTKVKLEEQKFMKPLDGAQLKVAAKRMRAAGRRHGITKAAKSFLDRAVKSPG